MGCCQTFFAIIKAYTTLNIFIIPIGFKQGGYLFSPIVLALACFFELTCAIKITEVANKVKIYSYPDIVDFSLGRVYLKFYHVVQACLNLVFTFGPLAFFMKTWF
jgi:amino acid permease